MFCLVNILFPSITRNYRQYVNTFIETRLINREISAFDKRYFSIDYLRNYLDYFRMSI